MKQYWFFILIFFCRPVLGSADFNELGKNPQLWKAVLIFPGLLLKWFKSDGFQKNFSLS